MGSINIADLKIMEISQADIDHCRSHIPCGDPSDTAIKAVYILDRLYYGLHHCDDVLQRVKKGDWTNPHGFRCTVDGHMGTWDFNELTRLVILCHDMCMRCEIKSCGPRYFKLCFSQRERTGSYTSGHPTMAQAIEQLRDGVKYSDQMPEEERQD